MNMSLLQSILFGLVSGFSEFLPISARGQGDILLYLFGISGRDPVMSLIIHVGMLIALYTAMRPQFDQLNREKKLMRRSRNRMDRPAFQLIADIKLVKNAVIPMLFVVVIIRYILRLNFRLPVTCLILLINGIILYLPERMMQGNKNASGMSPLDSYLMGLCGGVSILSGFSGVGLILSTAISRGADRQKAWNWALLLMFPVLAAESILDIIDLISGSGAIAGFGHFFHYLLAGLFTFAAARGGIALMRRLVKSTNTSVFAYYCWGAALFSFLLYLSVI